MIIMYLKAPIARTVAIVRIIGNAQIAIFAFPKALIARNVEIAKIIGNARIATFALQRGVIANNAVYMNKSFSGIPLTIKTIIIN